MEKKIHDLIQPYKLGLHWPLCHSQIYVLFNLTILLLGIFLSRQTGMLPFIRQQNLFKTLRFHFFVLDDKQPRAKFNESNFLVLFCFQKFFIFLFLPIHLLLFKIFYFNVNDFSVTGILCYCKSFFEQTCSANFFYLYSTNNT